MAILLLPLYKIKKDKLKSIGIKVVSFSICFYLAFSYFTGGTLYDINRFYVNLTGNNISASQEEEADFIVTNYKMDLKAVTELDINCTMDVDNTSLDRYIFTLYYNYDITSITNQDDVKLEYDRTGNYLTVYNNESLEISQINISYHGNSLSSGYYVDSQQIVLPAYFAYYPMAGFLGLVNDGRYITTTSYELSNLPCCNFDISIGTSLQVVTNLELGDDGRYYGYCQGATILAGLIEAVEYDGVQTIEYLYKLQSGNGTDSSWVTTINTVMTDYYDKFGIAQEDRVSFDGKDIITIVGMSGTTSVFSDHVVVAQFGINASFAANVVAYNIVMSNYEVADEKSSAEFAFYQAYLDIYNYDIWEKYSIYSEDTDEFRFKYYLYYLDKAAGEEYTSQAVFNYLTDPDDTRLPYEFVEDELALYDIVASELRYNND